MAVAHPPTDAWPQLHAFWITVIVTGGAGGLGKAIATGYLEAGANVAICDIHTERLDATRAEFASSASGRVLAVKTDITDENAVQQLVSDVVSEFGRLDILVNNAGMADTFDPVGSLDKKHWDTVLNLNLTGSFLCMKAAVQAMEKQSPSGGTIIQIGSIASLSGVEAGVAYTDVKVSKHGVAALVKSTAGFYGPKSIYAIGLMLGAMPTTNIADGAKALGNWNMEAFMQSSAASFKPESAVDVKDVAKYCVFLADKGVASTATGSCITFSKNTPRA
ncbi:NAD(P)-binding protein [Xylariaceae sp. FL0016]|nr:NAD(P)-binding protein [Xylariaceae sp. FL0016]